MGKPTLLFYALGSSLAFFALVPLSEMATQIVEAAIVKVHPAPTILAFSQFFCQHQIFDLNFWF